MANDHSKNPPPFPFEVYRFAPPSSIISVDELSNIIVQARIEFYQDYKNIQERAKKGEHITGDDFISIHNKYSSNVADLDFVPPDILSVALTKAQSKLNAWEQANPEILRDINNTESLNEAFRRDYLKSAPRKDTSIRPGTSTPRQLIEQLLENNDGIAIGGTKGNEAEIVFLTENMKLFREKGYTRIDIKEMSESFVNITRMPTSDLKEELEHISREIEKTPSSHKSFASLNVNKNVLKFVISAKENGVTIRNADDRHVIPDNIGITQSNFTLTDIIKAGGEKSVLLGDLGNFIGNGKVDEALAFPVIVLYRGDSPNQPAIERGTTPNGPDFYIKTHACRPDTKGLALAGDYDDMSKAILKNIDRMPNEEDAKVAKHYASLLDKKAENLRSDYTQSLEVCDVPTREASAPPATPAPVRVASNIIIKK